MRRMQRLRYFLPLLGVLTALVLPGAQGVRAEAVRSGDASAWMPRPAESALRVLSWNVARDDFFQGGPRARALLAAAAPDVLLLDEMPEDATPEAVRAFIHDALPGADWQVVLGDVGGNRERGSIVARWPLVRIKHFDALHYTRQQRDRWISAAGPKADKLRATLPAGVAAAGAIADVAGRQLLFVSFDMQCCGDAPDAWEEARRRAEARLIREAIARTLAEHRVDAIVLAGDANNVQNDQVIRLLQGEAPALQNTRPQREDGSDWTWDGRGTPFASKKIDHMLHSDQLRPLAARLLDTEFWPESLLRAQRLSEDASKLQSPHRPIVVDFALVEQKD